MDYKFTKFLEIFHQKINFKLDDYLIYLEDNSEVVLKSKDSEKILLAFDMLNENNQVVLINNIKFKSTRSTKMGDIWGSRSYFC